MHILCSIGIHKYEYQYDAGREKSVTMTSGIRVWMGNTRIICSRCKKDRPAQTAKDYQLPEVMTEQVWKSIYLKEQ